MTSLGRITGKSAGISVYIRLELSLRFGAERGPGMRKRPENKGFSRAATLGSLGFTPNMGYARLRMRQSAPRCRALAGRPSRRWDDGNERALEPGGCHSS